MIAVGFASEEQHNKADILAKRMDLVVNNQILPRLCVTDEKLVLLIEGFSPLFADFNDTAWKRRHKAGKKQGLVRACKPGIGMRIVDATAGWGRDAALLASFGADVLMIERHPVMGALLEDALQRLEPQSFLSRHLSLQCMDAKFWLEHLVVDEFPDVIYLDPMHPERQKSALVKKDMQALQHLLGTDQDAHELLELAKKRTKGRVVVKWPQRLPPLFAPDVSFSGKTVRFDVYFSNN